MAVEPYRQAVPGVNASIEKGTARAPEGRHYYVFHEGLVVGKHRSLKAATEQFRALLNDLGWKPSPQQLKMRDPATEAVEQYMDDLEAYWADAGSHRRRGGKTMYRS